MHRLPFLLDDSEWRYMLKGRIKDAMNIFSAAQNDLWKNQATNILFKSTVPSKVKKMQISTSKTTYLRIFRKRMKLKLSIE